MTFDSTLLRLAVAGTCCAVILSGAAFLRGRSQPGQVGKVQQQTPQWEIDAGSKLNFEVASVKPNRAAFTVENVHSNVPLGPQDAFVPTGGLFTATNQPLIQYLLFAYKLSAFQFNSLLASLPKWTTEIRFDIQARTSRESY